MNAINVIAPYRHLDMWVFDDERVGLVQEPFVCGIDTMLDLLTAPIANAEKGFVLLFSVTAFPGHDLELVWLREDNGGNWYYSADLEMEGWLCPALFKYFDQAPVAIYIKLKEKKLLQAALD